MSGVYQPLDPDFDARVRASFGRQGIMGLLGARLERVEPGVVSIGLDYRDALGQQHGFFHAGVTSTIADSAGGYAAFTLFPADSSVVTVEYKMNFAAPAEGDRILATGRVKKFGRTLTVCDLEVVVERAGRMIDCAYGLQTLICLHGKPDRPLAGEVLRQG